MTETFPVYAVHVDTVRQLNWTELCQSMPARMERAQRYRFEKDRLRKLPDRGAGMGGIPGGSATGAGRKSLRDTCRRGGPVRYMQLAAQVLAVWINENITGVKKW